MVRELDAILIAGPTASGKSALAMELAERHGGVVVNADSMQVYDALRILTARPPDADMARVEHRLYGHVPAEVSYSTGAWYRDAAAVVAELRRTGRVPVFVGGTGLYFRALLGGLSDMPATPPEIRQRWRERLAEEGAEKLHAELAERDPEAAKTIRAADRQRIVRALEVVDATGRSILSFQSGEGVPLIDANRSRKILLMPDRQELRARIATRFRQMVEEGAINEVRRLLDRGLAIDLPAMKAIGVKELQSVIENKSEIVDAEAHAVTATRQYAKRQMTWFRNQLDENWATFSEPEQALADRLDPFSR